MIILHQKHCMRPPVNVIGKKARAALSFITRLLGLMFRKSFGIMDALILYPCDSIHTFFMRFNIDVLCLDEGNAVCDMAHGLRPGRVFMPRRRCCTVVELPEGTLRHYDIGLGDVLFFEGE